MPNHDPALREIEPNWIERAETTIARFLCMEAENGVSGHGDYALDAAERVELAHQVTADLRVALAAAKMAAAEAERAVDTWRRRYTNERENAAALRAQVGAVKKGKVATYSDLPAPEGTDG